MLRSAKAGAMGTVKQEAQEQLKGQVCCHACATRRLRYGGCEANPRQTRQMWMRHWKKHRLPAQHYLRAHTGRRHRTAVQLQHAMVQLASKLTSGCR